MLMRSMIRVKTLPACVNGHLSKQLNTNTSTDAAVCGESKPKSLNDSSHKSASQHLKSPTDESVSLIFLLHVCRFYQFNFIH